MINSKFKNIVLRYIVMLIGCYILGLGIGFTSYANLGADCITVFLTGTYQRLGVTLGVMNMFVNGSQVAIAVGLDSSTVSLPTFLGVFATGFGIDSFYLLGLPSPTLFTAWISLLVGLLIYSFGIALSQVPKCGYNSFDALIFSILSKTPKLQYHHVLWIVSILYIVAGWLLGGVVGVGTVIVTLFTGPLVEKEHGWLVRHMKFLQIPEH